MRGIIIQIDYPHQCIRNKSIDLYFCEENIGIQKGKMPKMFMNTVNQYHKKTPPRRQRGMQQGYTRLNKIKLIRGGKEYFDCLIHMIETAQETIHLQTYIFDDDETGQNIGNALKAAARRNVQVFVMVDSYASRLLLSRHFIHGLIKAGVRFRFFEPFFKSRHFYFGRRLHHKVVVTDTKYALTGGINISNRYNDMPGKPAWLDFALFAEGEIVKELCILCWKSWYGYPRLMELTPCELKPVQFNIRPEESCEVSMRRNDWVRRKNEISSTYVDMFRHAQSQIIILCSYFLPGRVIRRQLADAARRGVRIKVITAGVSDIWIAKYAERHIYKWLLQHNVELYEYKPNVLHGKIAVCDSRWVTLGSYNVNDLSAYASIELNINVRQEAFAKKTELMLLDIATKDCIQITRDYEMKSTNIFKRFARWFSYGFIHLVLYISTFYYKHNL